MTDPTPSGRCRTWTSHGIPVITPPADLDITTAPDLRHALTAAAASRPAALVVDLTGNTFCDSSGLGALLYAMKHTRDGTTGLRLAGPARVIRRIFKLTGAGQYFTIYPTVAEATAVPPNRPGHPRNSAT